MCMRLYSTSNSPGIICGGPTGIGNIGLALVAQGAAQENDQDKNKLMTKYFGGKRGGSKGQDIGRVLIAQIISRCWWLFM